MKIKKKFLVITLIVVELACLPETVVYAMWLKQMTMVYFNSLIPRILSVEERKCRCE